MVNKKNQSQNREIFNHYIKVGEIITDSHVKSIRPGYGLQPKFIEDIIGTRSTKEIKAGTPVKKEHL